mmetsp:Transcript_33410/g.46629  ORF Transcript_33410/g.46629 Transcript_33410/m.46629 type:complete len:159 (-) Transcript_33410:199-675(-)|eukprot:CAMPEP_0185252288 /NCGR_PEP_ID=MMETSP1359-20130426/1428_1 /TAXON_ID=552665 /ORGANISM="Bigelowiella longifila, Strain CCMP242" /LENGTH=158 /DNA_ID=CAMNT_0027834419 /DNA_START=152 /DNA_END=628 /DNA_ORIENTATION=-
MREMFKDEKLMTHLPMLYNISENAMQKRRTTHREDYKKGSSCFFDVVELSSGELIGTSGFRSVDGKLSEAEWGIIITGRCQRKGLAAECLSMCRKHAKEVLKVCKITANTSVKNEPMVAFFKKHGFKTAGKWTMETSSGSCNDNSGDQAIWEKFELTL